MSSAPPQTPPVVRALLAGAIDYAGLFPPAELDMDTAVNNYLDYRASPEAWALARFVVPVSRLGELEQTLHRLGPDLNRLIPVSALLGTGTADDVDATAEFDTRCREFGARIDAIEVKAASVGAARGVLAAVPRRWLRYLELPLGPALDAGLEVVVAAGAFAKVRTGGITPASIPAPDDLLAFLEAVARRRIPFKATAGLHHPVRGSFPLTYDSVAPSGVMHGYLNLMVSAAILWRGGNVQVAREALLEEDPTTLRLNGDAFIWRNERLDTSALNTLRHEFFHGFGSCSFREPVDELPLWSAR